MRLEFLNHHFINEEGVIVATLQMKPYMVKGLTQGPRAYLV